MFRGSVFVIAALLLAACDSGAGPQQAPDDANVAPTTINNTAEDSLIRWPDDPFHIIFRAEIAGGQDAIYRLSEVPLCTIYGDQRIVWTTETSGGTTRVLFDVLDRTTIENFVNQLAIVERFYTYEADYDSQLIGEREPVYERMALHVNGQRHEADAFGNWPINYFVRLVDICQKLSNAPTQFEPSGAWLSTQEVSYKGSVPSINWEPGTEGVRLSELADSAGKRWVEGNIVRALWDRLYETAIDLQLVEVDDTYQIALEVPGVTVSAPPAPLESAATEEP
jgi:hypothetical protein